MRHVPFAVVSVNELLHLASLGVGDVDRAVPVPIDHHDGLELLAHHLEGLVADPKPRVGDEAVAAGKDPEPAHTAGCAGGGRCCWLQAKTRPGRVMLL